MFQYNVLGRGLYAKSEGKSDVKEVIRNQYQEMGKMR